MDKQQFECFTLSPLDGRYAGIKDALGEYFSEYALVKYRVFVEIQWLKFNWKCRKWCSFYIWQR